MPIRWSYETFSWQELLRSEVNDICARLRFGYIVAGGHIVPTSLDLADTGEAYPRLWISGSVRAKACCYRKSGVSDEAHLGA